MMNTNATGQPSPSSLMDYWTKCNPDGIAVQKPECCSAIKSETSPIIDTFAVSDSFYANNATSSCSSDGQACFVETSYAIPWDGSWQPELVAKYSTSDVVIDPPADWRIQDYSNRSYSDLSNSFQFFQSASEHGACANMAQNLTVYDLSNPGEPLPQKSKDELHPAVTQQAILVDKLSNTNPAVVFANEPNIAPDLFVEILPEDPIPPPKQFRQSRDELWETIKPKGKFSCSSCDRTFKLKQHLVQHNNAKHSGPRQHRCPICGKRFDLAENLEKHQRRHKDQSKEFMCKYCPKRFNYFFDMRRHMQANHEEAPHSCSVCGKRYVRMDHLLMHENKHRKQMIKAEQGLKVDNSNDSMLKVKEE